MTKRSVFHEVMQGVEEMKADREGKVKLKRTTVAQPCDHPGCTPELVAAMKRKKLFEPEPPPPQRIVLGEGRMRYSQSKFMVLEDGSLTYIVWPDLPGDPRIRLVLEVIE